MLGHTKSLNTFKKIEITSSIFSDHKFMRLEIKSKGKKNCKNTEHVEAKQYGTKQSMDY